MEESKSRRVGSADLPSKVCGSSHITGRKTADLGRHEVCATNFEHRLAIELEGGVHSQPSQMRRAAVKEDYFRTGGIRLLRIAQGSSERCRKLLPVVKK